MHHATQAYAKMAQTTANPREFEAQLLMRAASRLQAAIDQNDFESESSQHAVKHNRRLWSLLVASIASADNPLPQEIKQNLVNLGAFVLQHSLAAEARPDAKKYALLISINREIAAGLRTPADAPNAAPQPPQELAAVG